MTYVKDINLLKKGFPINVHAYIDNHQSLRDVDIWNEGDTFRIGQEGVVVPQRVIYQKQIEKVDDQIELCILSRSHDGLTREAAVKKLLTLDLETYALPYVLESLSDYAIEISNILPMSGNRYVEQLKTLVSNNIEATETIRRRTVSYWDEYYRREARVPRDKNLISWGSYSEYPPFKYINGLISK